MARMVATDGDVLSELSKRLVGQSLLDFQLREHDWVLVFGVGVAIVVSCFWRIVVDGRIALADEDDGQMFGLPEPVNASERAQRLLAEAITNVAVRQDTGDLTLWFGTTVALELLNNSMGYEAWHFCSPGFEAVAMGGGQIATVLPDAN
jgi:hypothetical protein